MLVDVVEMRRRGQRLPREEVLAARRVRGELVVNDKRPGSNWRRGEQKPLLAGVMRPGSFDWAIPPLDYARITRVRGASMVIVGLQEVGTRKAVETYKQAWWVTIVTTEQR